VNSTVTFIEILKKYNVGNLINNYIECVFKYKLLITENFTSIILKLKNKIEELTKK